MKAYKEITDWDVSYRSPNHVYLLDSDKMLAYIPYGKGKPTFFRNPIRFDRRGRKFLEVDTKIFGKLPSIDSVIIKVQGSKGNVYNVDPVAKTCTCPGFTFRGACKHILAAA
jgi:hypothetical protein